MAVGHVKQRVQFGVPIGSFQAVKHKAADMYVAIERARALAYFSALTIAEDDPRRGRAARMAKAAAGECQRVVFRHGLQLFGGHGLHLGERAADLPEAGQGLRPAAGPGIGAPEGAAGDGRGGMRLGSDPEAGKFRAELAAFLDSNLPGEAEAVLRSVSSSDMPEWARKWQRTLFDAGWLLPGQPPEYGGRNATLPQQLAYLEELSERRIYHSFNPQGLGIIAASILTFGTQEQKQRWAVPILRAEITASLGMSEPGAGSDLAGLRTRAVPDGDVFVVNGQKVWTSGAHDADVLLTFVRTDPDAPKHRASARC